MEPRYAGSPTAVVFEDDNGKKGRKKLVELLWGDLFDLVEEPAGQWARVGVRKDEGTKIHSGWIKKSDIQTDPVLEVTFVDIGQGDGCLLIMPDKEAKDRDRRAIVIDAGEGDSMKRYLSYRFFYPSERRPYQFHAGIVSHPDADHYKGFDHVFGVKGISFANLYHNGLVERKGDSSLGPRTDKKPRLFTDLIKTRTQLEKLLKADAKIPGRKLYPDMLRKGLEGGKFDNFQMLCRDDKFMPGFGPGEEVTIEVLGPVVEKVGKHEGLRDFGSTGFTKNGHSVVLRLSYGNVRMLLGGDLNIPSEELLLKTIMRRAVPDPEKDPKKYEQYIADARAKLEVDVAKSCHHGSADFASLFLEAVNPVATVISSGDDEPHSHPRAETLGAIGVNSRGRRPLIFSTELARSAKDAVRDPRKERADLKRAHAAVLKETDKIKRAALGKAFRKLVDDTINRTVQVYGAIYVRTDGKDVVVAQRIERGRAGRAWDVSELHPDEDGKLTFQSKHENGH